MVVAIPADTSTGNKEYTKMENCQVLKEQLEQRPKLVPVTIGVLVAVTLKPGESPVNSRYNIRSLRTSKTHCRTQYIQQLYLFLLDL